MNDDFLDYSFKKFIKESEELIHRNNNELNWKIIKLESGENNCFLKAFYKY